MQNSEQPPSTQEVSTDGILFGNGRGARLCELAEQIRSRRPSKPSTTSRIRVAPRMGNSPHPIAFVRADSGKSHRF